MNIVAVIPARAGSKGIPNKNIKLLNSKPLICYSIENAINCKYITEVIVTTDSKEVELISRQMGAKPFFRKKELSGDDITLDSVVYDVVENLNFDYDYVITMQPTSPTLKVETLETAIEYILEKNLDTLISCVNKPHLSWCDNTNGEKQPNYEQRVNRQYLPSNYIETGAFVISKKDVISKYSRIGKKIDIFEIPNDEAIDIDDYLDFMCCQNILNQPKVAFYVNGNNEIGMGHIYRCLEMADEFNTKPDIYYDKKQTTESIFCETNHTLIGIQSQDELFSLLKNNNYDILINDILNTSIDYIVSLKKVCPSMKIINFEDVGEGIYEADCVINALYNTKLVSNMHVGYKYYICSKLFMFYKPISIKKNVDTVFISFGGADPQNYTDRLLNMIISEPTYNSIKFRVVLGRAKKNIKSLMEYNIYQNIEVLYDIKNMPEIISSCDIAVTSRGRTGYELAILGLPTIAMAQNLREENHSFISNENGFSYIGLNPSDYIIKSNLNYYINMDQENRLVKQKQLLKHNLKNGRKNVMKLINNL